MPIKELMLKLVSPVLVAFFLAFAGIATAAPLAPAATDSATPQQTGPQTPPDCKKTPQDPRCKDR